MGVNQEMTAIQVFQEPADQKAARVMLDPLGRKGTEANPVHPEKGSTQQ